MAILFKNVDENVMNFIYDKQLEFRKKGRSLSLEKVLEILLRDAYGIAKKEECKAERQNQ